MGVRGHVSVALLRLLIIKTSFTNVRRMSANNRLRVMYCDGLIVLHGRFNDVVVGCGGVDTIHTFEVLLSANNSMLDVVEFCTSFGKNRGKIP